MKSLKLLWIDDEVDMLKPFVMFLEAKGYNVRTVSNGADALSLIIAEKFDLILLDEMMPGMDGLAVLHEIKKINSFLPVIMVTKSEEEGIMDNAIASQIEDYLIKPINPSQIIMSIKKIFQSEEIKRNKIGQQYAQFSMKLDNRIYDNPDFDKWSEIYKDICTWDVMIDKVGEETLEQTHFLEKLNANKEFCDYVSDNYLQWLKTEERPILSFDIISQYVIPQLEEKRTAPVYFIILDCMRLDQYLAIEPYLKELFDIDFDMYYSILPTATPYSRNSIFSGILPDSISKNFPNFWTDPFEEETSRNRNEHQLMEAHLEDFGYGNLKTTYVKIFDVEEGNFVLRKIDTWKNEDVVILVYNFLDLLAHHRSKSSILQETIPDDSAMRAFTKHWFLHSNLYEALKMIKEKGATIVLTTDHGAIRVSRATQVSGDKETTPTVRYKHGKNLKADPKHSFYIKDPEKYGLPSHNIVDNYVFAKQDYYFVYPNYFHQYQKQYNGTYQHGGISMEEMLLPVAVGKAKK